MTLFRIIRICALIATIPLCAGCGGGGSSSGVSGQPTGTVITGTVAKGPFTSGGVVECYFVSGATRGPLFRSAAIDSNGSYRLDIGTNSGIVLLEAYGSYLDESTNQLRTISKASGDRPLRAVLYVSGPVGTINVAITPLTELAVRNAFDRSALSPPDLTQATVTAANRLVSDIFTFDIQATQPVQPAATALYGASDAQKRYTMVLTGISQLAPTPAQVDSLMESYSNDLAVPPNRISGTHITALLGAIETFLDTSLFDNTGYSYAMAQQIPLFPLVGYYTTTVTVTAVQNTLTADTVANVVQFALLLDDNLTVEHVNGIPNSSVITVLPDPATTYWDAQLVTDSLTGDKALNVSIVNTVVGLHPNESLATIRIKTNPGFSPAPTSIQVKHLYQNSVENTAIPFAAKDLQSTTVVDWSVTETF